MKIVVRILVIGAVGLVLLVGGLYLFLGPVIRAALQRGGQTALGVPTPVAAVTVRPLAGDLSIDGLTVRAPSGFEHPDVLRLGRAAVTAPVTKLRDDPLVIERVLVADLAVVIERRDGVFNYEPLLENARRFSGPPSERTEPQPDGPQRRIVIREFALEGVRLTADLLPGTVQAQTVALGNHVIRDIEVGGDADPMGELFARLLDELIRWAMAQGGGLLTGDLARELAAARAQLEARAAAEIEALEERARDAIDEAAERIGERIGGDPRARDAAEEAKRRVGGILGRDR